MVVTEGLATVLVVVDEVTILAWLKPVAGNQAYVYGLEVGAEIAPVNVALLPLHIVTSADEVIDGGVH